MKMLVLTLKNYVCKSPIAGFLLYTMSLLRVIDMSLSVGLTRVIEFPRFTSIGRWLCVFRIYAYTCDDPAIQLRSSDDDSPTHVTYNRCGSYFVAATDYNITTITFVI